MWGTRYERWRHAGLTLLLAVFANVAAVLTGTAQARSAPVAALADTVAVAELPAQGRSMLTLIYQGGPFRHDKDGVVFGNRERLLPANARAYYREYTVRTPGERSRGARRIVCGGLQATVPDACFYTDDHYASFRKIVH
ncbi:MAG: ribonuclease [Polaromonas sp.]|nr:ribonuclease [Polaromonas sp.]